MKPLLRHRMVPLLVVLQVALACAIACNALFLLQQKLVPILAPDGVGHPDRLIVASSIVPSGQPWSPVRLYEVEQALRAIPGVTSVSVAGSLPMATQSQMNGDVMGDGVGIKGPAAVYIGDHLVDTLGLKLVAGRNFSDAEETVHYKNIGINDNGSTIITRSLAVRLFPDGQALGRVIRIGDQPDAAQRRVVGLVEHLMRNKLGEDDREDIDYTMLFPGIPGNWPIPYFAVRADSATDVVRVRKAVEQTLQRELGAGMVKGIDPSYAMYGALRASMLAQPKAAVWLLSGVSLIVLLVTVVGIMGLTSYWVQQRTRQIGVRRALGARRGNILRDVQLENLLVVG
ncbi:MAG TPA: FtsX-like permease family protein, partial [Rhodanobacter sp.]